MGRTEVRHDETLVGALRRFRAQVQSERVMLHARIHEHHLNPRERQRLKRRTRRSLRQAKAG